MANDPRIPTKEFLESIGLQHKERYLPSTMDESHTILEKLNRMGYDVNENTKITSEVIKRWNEFSVWLDQEFPDDVNKQITDHLREELTNEKIVDLTKPTINNLVDGKLTEVNKNLTNVTLQLTHTDKYIPLSKLGLSPSDGGINNFNKLTDAMQQNTGFLVDGQYKLQTTVSHALLYDLNLKGNHNNKLTLVGDVTLFRAGADGTSISLEGINITSNDGTIFYEESQSKRYLKKVVAKNCKFENNISFFRYSGNSTLNPANSKFGIEKFEFVDNEVIGTQRVFINLVDCPHQNINISNNKVKNFLWSIANIGINSVEYENEMSKAHQSFTGFNNLVFCDDTIINPEGNHTYYTFILYEGVVCEYRNNHVEGMKTFINKAVYDIYANGENVIYDNNTTKNNVCLAEGKDDNLAVLMKAKSKGKRTYTNSKFIIEKAFVEKFTTNFLNSVVQLYQCQYENEWLIQGNEFDVYALSFSETHSQIKKFYFLDNKIKAETMNHNYGKTMVRLNNLQSKCDVLIDRNDIEIQDGGIRLFGTFSTNNPIEKVRCNHNRLILKNVRSALPNILSTTVAIKDFEFIDNHLVINSNEVNNVVLFNNSYIQNWLAKGNRIESNIKVDVMSEQLQSYSQFKQYSVLQNGIKPASTTGQIIFTGNPVDKDIFIKITLDLDSRYKKWNLTGSVRLFTQGGVKKIEYKESGNSTTIIEDLNGVYPSSTVNIELGNALQDEPIRLSLQKTATGITRMYIIGRSNMEDVGLANITTTIQSFVQ